uniref:Uncharacterized protein n=1 Tax=Anguilla anguilla TaxID=7936 RepID=A0A0E9R481_ANGAN
MEKFRVMKMKGAYRPATLQ